MTEEHRPEGFTTRQVSDISGVPMSTLHYWAKEEIVRPSLRGSEGRRVTRWWSLSDLVAVRAVKALRESGCPLQTLRRAQAVIEEAWDETIGSTILHWDGVDLLRVGSMGEVQSVVKHPGQAVLHLVALPLGEWRAENESDATPVDLGAFVEQRRKREQRRTTSVVPADDATG